MKNKIKPSLHSRYDTEACNEWRGPSPRLSAWATQLRNLAAMGSCWRHCANFTGPGIEPKTSRTDSDVLTTELTGWSSFAESQAKKAFSVSLRCQVKNSSSITYQSISICLILLLDQFESFINQHLLSKSKFILQIFQFLNQIRWNSKLTYLSINSLL